MEEIVNLVATDSSASDISDRIKDVLFAKAADKINSNRKEAASSLFNDKPSQDQEDQE
tara:strand:- start:235 stop:408 length:174 start_codon:yes stop_codon:yes gene_type:complete